jgi:hypothetical protein
MTKTVLRILLAAAMVTGAGDCWAQQRSGLMGGVSLGGGSLSLEGSAGEDAGMALVRQRDSHLGTFSADLHLGGMLNEKTAFMLVVTLDNGVGSTPVQGVELEAGDVAVAFPSSATSLWSGVMGGAVQRWLTSRVWVRGGVGAGYLQREFTLGSDADYLTLTLDRGYAFAVLAGAGADIYRRSNFAIGAEFHFRAFSLSGVGVYAPSVQVGFNWY